MINPGDPDGIMIKFRYNIQHMDFISLFCSRLIAWND